MDNKLNKIKELVKQLNKYSYEYYTLDNPSISDKEFDVKYNELLALEKETGIVLPDSPTQKVGGEILEGFEKVNHKNKLWSLDKSQSKEEMKAFILKAHHEILKWNSTHPQEQVKEEYVVTKKFDGLTVKVNYENGKYILGSTRGTGLIGENITDQASTIINLPLTIDYNKPIAVHGEGLMTKKALVNYNKTAKEPLKNLRNGVAGALRNLNPKETAKRKCIIQFYNINETEEQFETYSDQLEFMKSLGLPVAEYTICHSFEEVSNEIDRIESIRQSLPYDIDGAVVSVNNMKIREALGTTLKFPNHSMAYKYEAEETTTKLLDVEWNVSRTGKIVPTGIIEPVELMGVTVKRATLNNPSDIKRKNIKLGCQVFIRRSNDVIPEITGVVEESLNNPEVKEIEPPKTCPICGSPTFLEQTDISSTLYCTDSNCSAQLVQRMSHYVSRKAMNIDGFSEKKIEKLYQKGLLSNIESIYSLENHKSEIIKMDGFGLKTFNNLISAINNSKQCRLENFIFALGIPNVGEKTAENLVKFAKKDSSIETLKAITKLDYKTLLRMDDCGEVLAHDIEAYFSNEDNINFLKNLIDNIGIHFEEKEEVKLSSDKFKDKLIYCTGTFANYKKNELKQLVEENGGTFANGFSTKLDFLVVGSKKGSSKEQKAKDKGIPVIQEEDFINYVKNTCDFSHGMN